MDWKSTSGDEGESRNSWINRDLPTDVSSMAHYKDGYEDILEERRHKSDLKYCVKQRKDVPQYKYRKRRSPEEVKEHVIHSDRVKYTVEKLADRLHVTQEAVRREAQSILDEMAHSLNLKAVRGFAYFLIKIFKSLFRRIYVNEEGVRQLHRLIHEYPVLLMPTHRSYMDFLLISYIFYEYDLPLPVIAAAMDFSNMKFFGWLLRQCGAFYIRRSFGTDELYWAIFTEYVQTQLRNGDQPMEFFVEGTRSRTSKSYTPRIGMLAAALESYFKAELPDVMIVPISISYDRILEESLYAFELLGIPKPKESASGVFKARSILSEDFGCVHFFIADAISIRQFSTGHIDRVCHALEPRYINNLTKEEAELTTQLAFQIVREQQRHLVISPWAIMAAILMQSWETGISVRQLVKESDWLKRQAANMGAYVDWPGNTSPDSVVRHYLGLHTNILAVSDDMVMPRLVQPSAHVKVQNDHVMLNAATNIILSSYRNQLMHVFVRVAMVSLSINGCMQDCLSMDNLYFQYCFLEKIMARDFVFQPGHTRADFEQALLMLQHSGGLCASDGGVLVKKSITKHTTFYSQMFEPFLLAYWVLCQHLLSMSGSVHGRPLPRRLKDLARDAQVLGKRLVEQEAIKHYEVLSLDILGNGLATLASMGAMYKDKRNEENWLSPNHVMVSQIAQQLAAFIEVPAVQVTQEACKSIRVVLTAKI